MPTLLAHKIGITGAVRVIRPLAPTGGTGAYALPTGCINFRFIACYLEQRMMEVVVTTGLP